MSFYADPDPSLQIKAQNREKVLKSAHIHTLHYGFSSENGFGSRSSLSFDADADPDPAYHFDADPNPTFQSDAEPCRSGSKNCQNQMFFRFNVEQTVQ